jgi:hypothetical protein
MSFVSSLVGGILGSGAANDAASVESQAAKKAQDLEKQNQDSAITAQNTATSTNQANEAPYQALGSTSAAALQKQLQTGFSAPTLADAQNNPGYQFALQSGTTALDKSASATGNLLSGSEGTALQQYGQQLGTQNYQQVYNNALQNYMSNYQTLLGGTNVGQTAVSEQGQLGQAGAQNTANIDLTAADQQAKQLNNAAAARASGYMQSASQWGKAAGGMASGLADGFGAMDFSGGSSPLEMAGQFVGA